jgi:hypothetical protein
MPPIYIIINVSLHIIRKGGDFHWCGSGTKAKDPQSTYPSLRLNKHIQD